MVVIQEHGTVPSYYALGGFSLVCAPSLHWGYPVEKVRFPACPKDSMILGSTETRRQIANSENKLFYSKVMTILLSDKFIILVELSLIAWRAVN